MSDLDVVLGYADEINHLRAELDTAQQREAGLLRDRDALWCQSLSVLSTDDIQRVTELFNRLRPDAEEPPSE